MARRVVCGVCVSLVVAGGSYYLLRGDTKAIPFETPDDFGAARPTAIERTLAGTLKQIGLQAKWGDDVARNEATWQINDAIKRGIIHDGSFYVDMADAPAAALPAETGGVSE